MKPFTPLCQCLLWQLARELQQELTLSSCASVSTAAFVQQYTARKDALFQSGKIQPFPGVARVLANLTKRGWRLPLATFTERKLASRCVRLIIGRYEA